MGILSKKRYYESSKKNTEKSRQMVTRNSKKLQPTPNELFDESTSEAPATKKPPKPVAPSAPANPFGLSFVVPTQEVELPSRGAFYPTDSPLHGVTHVEVKHMTAKEEDLLSSATESESESVFDKLIGGILIDKSLHSGLFLEEDKLAILLAARITGYGQDYTTLTFCTTCDDTKEHVFDLTKSEIIKPNKNGVYNPENNTFSLKLPITGIELELLNYGKEHQRQLEKDRERKSKLNLKSNDTITFIKKVIISANGVEDTSAISQLAESLPAGDAKFIKSFFENCRPKIGTVQEVHCSECNSPSSKEVPLSWAFFRLDI